MVNYKLKYLEMKLKYINTKNKLSGGAYMGPRCDDVIPNIKVEHLPFNTGFITNTSVETRICVGGLLDCFGIFIKISAYPNATALDTDLLAIIAAHCNPSTIYDTLTNMLTPYGINLANNLINIFNNRIIGIAAGDLEIETTLYADAEQIQLGVGIQNTINAALVFCKYLNLNQNLINCANVDNPYPSLNGQEWKDFN